MARSKIKWRIEGFARLRNEPGVLDDLQERANSIADAAGEGYESRPAEAGAGKSGRARAAVITGTAEARVDNARNQTLLRSLDAGA
ncbi:hypothetical protein [Microbacterium sp. NPDC087592]|uniref:hypothetical protein n=1 Tax=Microbacterium sp. NPDC087592 TaxID=3364193 RepID=UPI0038218AD2